MDKIYTSTKTVTRKMEQAMVGFINTARSMGEGNIWAALPANHRLVKENKVNQIRVIKGHLAEYADSVGNRVCLTTDFRVVQ